MRKSLFRNKRDRIVTIRLEDDVFDEIKEKYGRVSTYIANLIYSQPEFIHRHPKSIEKEKIEEEIVRLKSRIKELR